MRVLVIGSGGVGAAFAKIAARRTFFEAMVLADIDADRAGRAAAATGDPRVSALALDASDRDEIVAAIASNRVTAVLNAADPRFVVPIFDACFTAGVTYLDMAMSLSSPHETDPYSQTGVKLGDYQFERSDRWAERGLLALCGMGVEPGLADVFARYASDHLFSEIDELNVRDGADLVVRGYDFAPTFSIWTTIEECLNPPVIWERERGWYTTAPFSEPEVFDFPEGIGPVECVNVEHEEVLLMPRWIEANRVTFKYGLGDEFIDVLRTLHKLGLDRTEPVSVRGHQVAPRDVVAACLPNPADLTTEIEGRTCAGLWVTGRDRDGNPSSQYLYHVADNAETVGRDGAQAVVWQTALFPVVALELIAHGVWSGAGVVGPEAFDAVPFLDLVAGDYGSPWGVQPVASASEAGR